MVTTFSNVVRDALYLAVAVMGLRSDPCTVIYYDLFGACHCGVPTKHPMPEIVRIRHVYWIVRWTEHRIVTVLSFPSLVRWLGIWDACEFFRSLVE